MFGWLVLVRQNKPCGSRTLVAGNLMKTARWLPLSWERPGKEFLPSCRVHCSPWWEDLSLQKVVFTLWRRLVLQIMWSYFFLMTCASPPCVALWRTPYKLSVLSPHPCLAPYWCNRTHHFKQIVEVRTENQEDVTNRKLNNIQWISLVWSIYVVSSGQKLLLGQGCRVVRAW